MPMPLSVTVNVSRDAPAPGAGRRRREADAAALGELHRVVDQVFQRAAQPHLVAADAAGQVAWRYRCRRRAPCLARGRRASPPPNAQARAARTARPAARAPWHSALAASTTMVVSRARWSAAPRIASAQPRSRLGRSEACSNSASARMPVSGVRMSWASPASATSIARGRARGERRRLRAAADSCAWLSAMRAPGPGTTSMARRDGRHYTATFTSLRISAGVMPCARNSRRPVACVDLDSFRPSASRISR